MNWYKKANALTARIFQLLLQAEGDPMAALGADNVLADEVQPMEDIAVVQAAIEQAQQMYFQQSRQNMLNDTQQQLIDNIVMQFSGVSTDLVETGVE